MLMRAAPQRLQNGLYYGLLSYCLLLPLPFFFYESGQWSEIYYVVSCLQDVTSVWIAILLILIVANKRRRTEEAGAFARLRTVHLCLLGLLACGLLSLCFAQDRSMAIVGAFKRNEGILALVSYYAVFAAATLVSSAQRKRLLYAFAFWAGLLSLFGVLQGYDVLRISDNWIRRASVCFGNSNFYGSFGVIATALFFGYTLTLERTARRFYLRLVCGLLLTAVSFAGLLLSGCRSGFVGFICMLGLAAFLLFMQWRSSRREKVHSSEDTAAPQGRTVRLPRLLLLLAVCISVLFLVDSTHDNSVLGIFQKTRNELANAEDFSFENWSETGIFSSGIGSSRMGIWKAGLRMLPKYWLFGCGVDNLQILMAESEALYGTISSSSYIDKMHNEYLQVLLTQGAAALLFELALLFLVFFPNLKRCIRRTEAEEPVRMTLLLLMFGYLAQAFFNISVINIAPYFWLCMGLLCIEDGSCLPLSKQKRKEIA